MSFRGKAMMKKILRKVGEENLAPGLKESLQKCVPNSKIVMNRAKRGLFAGRHIMFGNKVSEDGGNKSRRSWKPNVHNKRLFSYILDQHIKVQVTSHALRCIDRAGGIDEYLLNTPYSKMDTEAGLFWKAKIESLYEELGKKKVVLFSAEDEAKFEQGFKELSLAEQEDRRRQLYGESEEGGADDQETNEETAITGEEKSHVEDPEHLVANSQV